jgi:alpha-N-acetylglucosaminidase
MNCRSRLRECRGANEMICVFHHVISMYSDSPSRERQKRKQMSDIRFMSILIAVALAATTAFAADAPHDPAADVLRRVIPAKADQFDIEHIDSDNGKDVFEIQSNGDRIVLRGNNGVSIASALNWYLKYDCHCETSWCGDNLNLPNPLPKVETKIRIVSPLAHRVAFNFCTFSYTMPFWDCNRWQREIDWMAMRGINMPLAITGHEAVWCFANMA